MLVSDAFHHQLKHLIGNCMFSPFFRFALLTQAWNSDDDDEPPFSPVVRKKAVKVKHVKRREKKFDKKVSFLRQMIIITSCAVGAQHSRL